MDVTKFQLVNRATTVNLPMFGAQPTDEFLVKAVDGLGPTAITLIAPDSVYQGAIAADRELVFRIGLNANYSEDHYMTPAGLRAKLYGLLSPQSGGLDVFAMDANGIKAKTSGYARTFEINPFATTPEVLVSISCVGKPYWEHPTEIEDKLNYGFTSVMYLPNIGQVDVGFKLKFQVEQDMPFLQIKNEATGQKIRINKNFDQFEGLDMNTIEGQREVRKYPYYGTLHGSVLGFMSTDSVWLTVPPGGAAFTLPDGSYSLSGPSTDAYRYTPLYWGI